MLTREEQEKYELEHDEDAVVARLTAIHEELDNGGLELPKTQKFIARAYSAVAEFIAEQQVEVTRGRHAKYKDWLRMIPADVASVICLRTAIRRCLLNLSRTTSLVPQSLMLDIGRQFELEVRIREAEAVNPMYMQKVVEQLKDRGTKNQRHIRRVMNVAYDRIMKGGLDSELTDTECIHLGNWGMEALVQAGIIEVERTTARRGTLLDVHLNPEVMEFLMGYSTSDMAGVLDTSSLVMRHPPDPWTNWQDGGFISHRRKRLNPLIPIGRKSRISERARLKALYTAENMPLVFQSVNYLQATPFKVHEPTFRAIQRVWRAGGGVLGVPTREFRERPPFPFSESWLKSEASEEEVQVMTDWKRRCVQWYEERKAWASRIREVSRFIKISADTPGPLWFPMQLDTRGRVYYRGIPNPQGTDLSKATLHFHEAKPLGKRGLYWLRVHIANSFGFDKERLDKRAQWTVDNWTAIERALDAPEDFPDVWGTDAPWCMFSAAWELREALRSGNPEGYCTTVPVHMDATCSGLQHFSAMLRDPLGGKYVNLLDEDKIGPKQDIYSRVAQCALSSMHKDLQYSEDEEIQLMAALWIKLGISRTCAKKPVNHCRN